MNTFVDPSEHIEVYGCEHGVRVGEPECMDCLMDDTQSEELPGWPLVILGFIAVASLTYVILEGIFVTEKLTQYLP